MTETLESLDKHYQAAATRWPGVPFAKEKFRQHAGVPPPPHPVDLFIAGAAGYRIDAAWTTLETDYGPPTRKVLERQPLADFQVDDLWGEAIVRLMSEDLKLPLLDDGRSPARIIRYRGLVALLNYLVVVSKRIAIERQRGRRESTGILESDDAPSRPNLNQATPEEDAHDREDSSSLPRTLAMAYASLSAEHQFLIAAIYRDGLLQKKAGALLGWSEYKTSREIAKAIESLKKALRNVADSRWNRELLSAWEGCWAACWKSVASPAKSPVSSGAAS